MTKNNIGRFKVDSFTIQHHPERVADVFARLRILPVRAEMLFERLAIEYTALCPEFDELPEGAMVPEYDLEITVDATRMPCKARFIRREP